MTQMIEEVCRVEEIAGDPFLEEEARVVALTALAKNCITYPRIT